MACGVKAAGAFLFGTLVVVARNLWPTETVHGREYSLLGPGAKGQTGFTLTNAVRVAVAGTVVGVFAGLGGRFVVTQLLAGNEAVSRWLGIFGLTSFVGLYAVMIAVLIIRKRRGGPEPSRPSHVPLQAIHVRCGSKNESVSVFGNGWLWINESRLYFWSDAFGFQLPRSLVTKTRTNKPTAFVYYDLPKGAPQMYISLSGEWKELKGLLDQFVAFSPGSVAGVLPPMQVVESGSEENITLIAVLMGFGSANALGLAAILLPRFEGLEGLNAVTMFIAGGLAGMSFGLMNLQVIHSARNHNRKWEKFKSQPSGS